MNTTLPALKKDYESKRIACQKYANANLISLNNADKTYLNLLIKRNNAELAYREAEGTLKFHKGRIQKQLREYEKELSHKGGVI